MTWSQFPEFIINIPPNTSSTSDTHLRSIIWVAYWTGQGFFIRTLQPAFFIIIIIYSEKSKYTVTCSITCAWLIFAKCRFLAKGVSHLGVSLVVGLRVSQVSGSSHINITIPSSPGSVTITSGPQKTHSMLNIYLTHHISRFSLPRRVMFV